MARTFAWTFGGATGQAPVPDLSGNGRGFTPTGNTTRTAPGGGYTYGGAFPNSVGLTQSAAGIQVGPSLTGLQTGARTVCGWASIASLGTWWFMEYYRTADDTGVWGQLSLSGTFRSRTKNSSGSVVERLVTTSTAHRFYAMTWNGTVLKVYQSDGTGVLQQIGADLSLTSVWTADVFRVFDGSGSAVVLTDWQGFDTALTPIELTALMAGPPAAAGTTINPATETDAAQPVGRRKTRTIGVPGETDAAQTVPRRKARTVVIAGETETAQPVVRRKVRTIGAAAETDAPLVVGRIKTRALGVAAEINAGATLGRLRAREIGAATEADAATAVARVKSRIIDPADETDFAQPVGHHKLREIGIAVESSQAVAFGRFKSRPISPAVESDTAIPITHPAIGIGIAVETDEAMPIRRVKVRPVGVAVEIDAALAAPRILRRAITAAIVIDDAQTFHVVKQRQVGAALELDAALQILAGETSVVPGTPGHLTVGHVLASGLTAGHNLPDLSVSNTPSSQLEVSHGV